MKSRSALGVPLAVAAAGLVALVVGAVFDAPRACFAYLAAWTYGVTIAIGALLLLMIGHAAKASWMVMTRRLVEAVALALPLYALLFVPIAASLPHLYPWAGDPDALDTAVRDAVLHKRVYLSPSFFLARTAFYFAVLVATASLLRRWSTASDARPSFVWRRRMRTLSGGGLPVVGLTVTWASFDWTMSLQPAWSSTIFGLYFFAGSFVAAIALVALFEDRTLHRSVGRSITPDHAQALGRVLFAMIIFWAYMGFSQLLIYWIADVPDEVSFYAARITGSWKAVTALLVFGHFVIPFFALLSRSLKRRPVYLAWVGGWMLLMHAVDVYWMIMPVHDARGFRPRVVDLAAFAFVGGLSWAWVALRHGAAAPLPRYAPELDEGLHYEAAL